LGKPAQTSTWPGWSISWKIVVGIGAIFAILGTMTGLWDRWFGAPSVVLIPPVEPGPTMEYDPKAKRLTFEVAFAAENTGKANETIVAIRGSLDSRTSSLIHFVTSDFNCTTDGNPLSSIPAGVSERVRCRLTHNFTSATGERLAAPGPLVLIVRLHGRHDVVYPVQYCITATDGFWHDFLASPIKTTRTILNPRDCE
jgi:hypothetical protein